MTKSIYSSEYKNVVKTLLKVRKEIGFTQTDVAQKLKKPQSYISKIERGERRVDVAELSVLARLYKKNISYFIK